MQRSFCVPHFEKRSRMPYIAAFFPWMSESRTLIHRKRSSHVSSRNQMLRSFCVPHFEKRSRMPYTTAFIPWMSESRKLIHWKVSTVDSTTLATEMCQLLPRKRMPMTYRSQKSFHSNWTIRSWMISEDFVSLDSKDTSHDRNSISSL